MKKLALSMIVKDETDDLLRCLRSVGEFVDGIYILQTSTNKETTKIARSMGAVVKVDTTIPIPVKKKEVQWLKKFFGWSPSLTTKDTLFYFDTARNKALKMVPKDFEYIMWLDADDILRNAIKLPEVIEMMDAREATSMFVNYIYEAEIRDGQVVNILIQHMRERIIRNNGIYKWVAPIHETLIPQSGEIVQIETTAIDVLHLSEQKDRVAALHRNQKILEKSIYDTKGKDPRPIYYLAKIHYDLHTDEDYKKAESLIARYLQSSGWSEERSQAYDYLAEIHRERKHYNKAIVASMNSLIESPKFPATYLSLAVTYMHLQEWDKAWHYLQLALKIPTPKTTLVVNPRDQMSRALEVLFNVSLHQNKLDEAWAAITQLKELFPEDPQINSQFEFMTQLRRDRDLTKDYVHLAKHLVDSKEEDALKALVMATPKSIRDNPIIADFLKQHRPPKVWDDKSIAIYCGLGYTTWSPDNLKYDNESFIGGSEEAVIYAARELTKQGYKVTVYGDPGEEGDYDGVQYKNYFKFNFKDEFNILIVWRIAGMFENTFKAKKTYLWLHDVPNSLEFTKERIQNISKVFFLSKAHRELLPDLSDEKVFITSNGFVEEFPKIKSTNIPTRCIWTSSYDRGLQHLLEIWGDIRKEVPDAELQIFYGWQLFDKFYYNNPERQVWKKKIESLMEQQGVIHGGRLKQRDIELEYKKSGLWVYPTDFYEINCISAIKAQAYGAVPVCMNYAALKETVQFGYKLEGDIWDDDTKTLFKDTVVKAMKETHDREKMMRWARSTYQWETVVTSWIKEFES